MTKRTTNIIWQIAAERKENYIEVIETFVKPLDTSSLLIAKFIKVVISYVTYKSI